MPTKDSAGTQQSPPAPADADDATGDMSASAAALSSPTTDDGSSPQSPAALTPAQSRMAALGMHQPFPPSTAPVKLRIFRGPLSATEKIWFWKDQMTDPQKLRTGLCVCVCVCVCPCGHAAAADAADSWRPHEFPNWRLLNGDWLFCVLRASACLMAKQGAPTS